MNTKSLSGYKIGECVHAGVKSSVYRARRLADHRPVVLKFPAMDSLIEQRVAELRHEHALLGQVRATEIIESYDLEEQEGLTALVMEDFDAQPLSTAIQLPMDPEPFLELALQLCDGLGKIHRAGIIHKDIKPANILINQAGIVKIIDFSIASALENEAASMVAARELLGTLLYMAPEQTGRMNRGIDQRADLYSLGVTFYELLSGSCPFTQRDAIELVHAHIARRPEPLTTRRPGLPVCLDRIVIRLMSKTPEDRYQSAYGLKQDLLWCRDHLNDPNFIPGKWDKPTHFQIPEKLYGRDDEANTLLKAFNRVAEGALELVLVSGFSGLGKSSLVQEIHKPIVGRRGFFIAGKFDQFNRNIPFAPFLHAIGELIGQVTAESSETVAHWRSLLDEALGANVRVLVDTIPSARGLLGNHPSPVQLPTRESQNRLEQTLMSFLRVFAAKSHPLVLFLDDLQWADDATLRLIQVLMNDLTSHHILLVGAYRDHEVDPVHPLMLMLGELRDDAIVSEIALLPLAAHHVSELLQDALDLPTARVAPLAREVHRRTKGNPFFIRTFLHHLHQQNLIVFDPVAGEWSWDEDKLSTLTIPDDLAELVIEDLKKLDPQTLSVLKYASFLGTEFDSHGLSVIVDQSPSATVRLLWPAIEARFVLPLDPSYRLLLQARDEEVPPVPFRFLHDRVRHAVVSLVEEEQRPALHANVGRTLLADSRGKGTLQDTLFDCLTHLNAATELLNPAERIDIAVLNLRAGQRAKASTAYAAALEYLRQGLRLVPEDAWETMREDVFTLSAEFAECTHQSGRPKEAERLLGELQHRSHSKIEWVKVCNLRIALYMSLGKDLKALQVGVEGLSRLGMKVPKDDDALADLIAQERAQVEINRAGRSITSLVDAPAISDPHKKAILNLLTNLLAASNLTRPKLFSLFTTRQVNISLRYGHAEQSAYGYVVHGFYLATGLGHYLESEEFGQLSLALCDKFGTSDAICSLTFVFTSYRHFVRPLQVILEGMQTALRAGLQSGDFLYLSYACSHILMVKLGLGLPLPSVRQDAENYLALMDRTRITSSRVAQRLSRQWIANLEGHTKHRLTLSDDTFDESAFLAELKQGNMGFGLLWYRVIGLQRSVLYEDTEKAWHLADLHLDAVTGGAGFYFVTQMSFYACIAAAMYMKQIHDGRDAILARITPHRQRIAAWAGYCPENYLHQHWLVEAEFAALAGDQLEAMDAFDQAIHLARHHGFVSMEAFASDRAALFHFDHGREPMGRFYLSNALNAYRKWGAQARIEQLEERHPELMHRRLVGSAPFDPTTTISSTTRTGHMKLDLSSAIKASHAFAMETELGSLVKKILEIVIQNAGAERGALVLLRAGQLKVLGSYQHGHSDIYLEGLHLDSCTDLPGTLIRLSYRTSTPEVLQDAREKPGNMPIEYWQRIQPRSVLCLPVLSQGRGMGVLYLENNMAPGVFTPDRLEILSLLSTQVAISIQHVLQVANLERARQSAEAANEAKSTFLANMSHELRTPLNAIIGYSEILTEECEDLEYGELIPDLDRIRGAGQHLLAIISDILDLSKIEAGLVDITRQQTDLPTLIEEVVGSVAPLARKRGNRIEVQLAPDIGSIETDSKKLGQILLNVLENAIKFTENGLVTLTLRREPSGEKDLLRFEVADTGIGMTAEQAEQIFEAFHQADNSFTRAYGGAGLGLAICRELCRALGGDITVVSEIGHGSVFTIELPYVGSTPQVTTSA